MQSVDFKGLDELEKDIADLIKSFPDMQRELHEGFADAIKKKVDSEIVVSLKNGASKIKRWQGRYVGSYGGYAAVRAVDTSTGAESPGAITNYLENGHKIRKPTGRNKRYKPRINKIYIDGYHFYSKASNNLEADIIKISERFANKIKNKLE
jgi:hypothetical protein